MTITASLWEIAVLIAAVGFCIITIAILPAVFRFKTALGEIAELARESKKTYEKVNFLLGKFDIPAADIEELSKRFKEVGLKAAGTADMVLDNVRGPIISIVSLVAGLESVIRYLVGARCGCDAKGSEKEGGGDNAA